MGGIGRTQRIGAFSGLGENDIFHSQGTHTNVYIQRTWKDLSIWTPF